MRIKILLGMVGAVALVALAACGKRPMTRPVPVFPSECRLLPAPAEVADTITVALLDTVEPGRAPWAGNASEELLFHHLYETLITVDCLGDIQAGLAESWNSGEGGRRWTFELHEDARFWDGTAVTAHDVVIGWQDALTLDTVIDSARAAGDRLLHVYLKKPHREVPRALSAPVFAVTKPSGDSQRLFGSGPYRLVTSQRDSAERALTVHSAQRESSRMAMRTLTAHPAFGREGPVIRFVETSVNDARDLLEGGIDVMVTADPTVIEYATGQSRLATIALPWDKTYVLFSTSRVHELRMGGTPGTASSDLSDRLARDAVRHDARGYRPGVWWDDLSNCDELSAAAAGHSPVPRGVDASSGLSRILFDSNDEIARNLAERIVALATTDPAVSPDAAAVTSAVPGLVNDTLRTIAVGVGRSELDSSLRRGDDFAYVVSVPRRPPDPCYEAHELADRVPWLVALGVDFPKALLPLVDTRAHLIAREDRFGLMVDWYGHVLIVDGSMLGK